MRHRLFLGVLEDLCVKKSTWRILNGKTSIWRIFWGIFASSLFVQQFRSKGIIGPQIFLVNKFLNVTLIVIYINPNVAFMNQSRSGFENETELKIFKYMENKQTFKE